MASFRDHSARERKPICAPQVNKWLSPRPAHPPRRGGGNCEPVGRTRGILGLPQPPCKDGWIHAKRLPRAELWRRGNQHRPKWSCWCRRGYPWTVWSSPARVGKCPRRTPTWTSREFLRAHNVPFYSVSHSTMFQAMPPSGLEEPLTPVIPSRTRMTPAGNTRGRRGSSCVYSLIISR